MRKTAQFDRMMKADLDSAKTNATSSDKRSGTRRALTVVTSAASVKGSVTLDRMERERVNGRT